ncbi:hypothetical protein [Sulfitobacter sp.]|uniref:hypothetical protein n=1 Tax=Sulfitobacter sp. TaxID=1903071 RepID=UPI0030014DEC
MGADDVVFSVNLHRGESSTSQVKALIAVISDVQATAPNEVTVTLELRVSTSHSQENLMTATGPTSGAKNRSLHLVDLVAQTKT